MNDEQRSAKILKSLCYHGPEIAALDETGRRIFFRACDLKARFWLNRTAEIEYHAGNLEYVATLIHAERYLADRLAYELAPWPKGKIKVESDSPYALYKRFLK
jgi:hypothetical protein